MRYEIRVKRNLGYRPTNTVDNKETAIAIANEIIAKNICVEEVQVVEKGTINVIYTTKKNNTKYNVRKYRNNYMKLY